MTETVTILMGDYGDRKCVFHSHYMGWEIWREYNIFKARPMMSYFAVLDGREPLHSGNLAGIKEAVREAADQ